MFQNATLFLYVSDVPTSTIYYRTLFGIDPVEAHPAFALFILPSGLPFALWAANDVQPPPSGKAAASEIGFKLASAAEVDQTYATWKARGLTIAMPPTDADFGRSFVVTDPDGHRLRFYAMR